MGRAGDGEILIQKVLVPLSPCLQRCGVKLFTLTNRAGWVDRRLDWLNPNVCGHFL